MFALADGTVVLAATYLTNHLACAHLTQQRLGVVRGERTKPRPADDAYQMLAYCTALGLDRGYLVYAKDAGETDRSHQSRTPGRDPRPGHRRGEAAPRRVS